MANQLLEAGLKVLAFSRSATIGFLDDIPQDQWCRQPVEGGNHTAWVVGHLASTDDYFLSTLSGRPSNLPESWRELFGMASKPVTDLSAYPAPAEMRSKLSGCREDLIAWLKSLDEKKLMSPLPQELQMFAPSHVELCFSLAWHEGLHAGQMTMVRRSLGIAPKFG